MIAYEFGPFRVDADQLVLTHDAATIPLGPKVIRTLLALVEQPGAIVTKRAMLDRVWPDGFVEESNLTQNIHVLRKTFRAYGYANLIETVPCRGYRFVGHVRRVNDAHAVAPSPVVVRTRKPRTARVLAVSGLVAAALAFVAFHAPEPAGPSATAALSGDAARMYEIGTYYWNLRTRDGVQKSIAYFSRVVDAAPNAAAGYAALAAANAAMGDYCYGTHRPSDYLARAREYARRALGLDPDSAEAHAALGYVALNRNQNGVAIAELRRALAVDPSYGPAQEWYGIALVRVGRLAEGVAHLEIAADLDPLSVATIAWLGSAALDGRRFDDALAYSRQALELSPDRVDVLTVMGRAYLARGDVQLAIAAFKRFGNVDAFFRPEAAALLANAYARDHRDAEAQAAFEFARDHRGSVRPKDLDAAARALGKQSPNPAAVPFGSHAQRVWTYG